MESFISNILWCVSEVIMKFLVTRIQKYAYDVYFVSTLHYILLTLKTRSYQR